MENLRFLEIFTEKDAEFNRHMVERGRSNQKQNEFPDRHGGKMFMNDYRKSGMFQTRNCDFSSDVLEGVRSKWGIMSDTGK